MDLTAEAESRDEVAGEEVSEESRDTTETAGAIDVSEVQSALEQVDLKEEAEEAEAEAEEESREEPRDEVDADESRDAISEPIDESHDEPIKEGDTTGIMKEDTNDSEEDTNDIKEDTKDTTTDTIDLTVDDLESPIALETKEVLEMTEDGHVDEEEVKEAVEKEEEEVDDMEEEQEEAGELAVPETPKSESSFGEFASEDEFGDFDDFEEMEEPSVSVPTLDTSREETPMASQTNLSAPSQAPVSVKSVLTEDSFSSFTSLSFATKSVLEDNGLTQTFVEAKEPAGQSFELSESASQIYALLCSVPNSELNFLKSFTRRLLLKDVGVPLDLDELLPRKEKQHFVIRRSRRSLDKASRSSRNSTDTKGTTPGGSRAATPTPTTDSSRAQTPVTVDTELKLDSWLRLVEIRPEQRERMEPEEVRELVAQLKTANVEAKLLLKQWQDKLALGYKNKEAFEAVVENMVGFAQKQRLKKGKK